MVTCPIKFVGVAAYTGKAEPLDETKPVEDIINNNCDFKGCGIWDRNRNCCGLINVAE